MRSNNRNANIAIGPGRIEQNCIIAAPHSHIDTRLTELQVAQDDLIQKLGRRGLRSRISPLNGSNSRPSEASSSVNGVALAQA
jgi:hypothetical protein